jgi:NADPH:quinone reductase-like Zn-dependent oxidoreductase
MRAFAIDRFGERGSVRELAVPEPEAGEVLVRVKAASVNAIDWMVAKGFLKDRVEHRFPLIPGVDVSGVVERVGTGVDGFAAGDVVYGFSMKPFFGAGTFAEFTALPAGGIAPRPSSVDDEGAAALPHTALTAISSVEVVDPQDGQVVLVVGASGGVGSSVTQLAARRGAHVVAVTRAKNAEYVRSLGASETIDYTTGDLLELVRSRHPGGVDAIIDLASDAASLTRLSELVRAGGRVVSSAGAADAAALGQRGLQGVNVNRASPDRLTDLTRLIEDRQLRLPAIRVYPLEQAADALAESERRHVRGKLVLTVS